MFGISIEKTNILTKTIHSHYQLDLSGYTLNHLRFRIRKIPDKLLNADQIIEFVSLLKK